MVSLQSINLGRTCDGPTGLMLSSRLKRVVNHPSLWNVTSKIDGVLPSVVVSCLDLVVGNKTMVMKLSIFKPNIDGIGLFCQVCPLNRLMLQNNKDLSQTIQAWCIYHCRSKVPGHPNTSMRK